MVSAHSHSGAGGRFGGGSSSSSSRNSNHSNRSAFGPGRHNTYRRFDDDQGDRSSSPSENAWCTFVLVVFTFGAAFAFFPKTSHESLETGLNYSRVFTYNRFFVTGVEARRLESSPGPVLYSYCSRPPLNETKTWSATYSEHLDAQSHHEWALWMNKGSVMEVDFEVNSPDGSSLLFAVLKGAEDFDKWRASPEDDVAQYRKLVRGRGKLEYAVDEDGDYYFAFGNQGEHKLQVNLQLNAKMSTYSTQGFVSSCSLRSNTCKLSFPLLRSSYVLLWAPGEPQEGVDVWRVRMTAKPRWMVLVLIYGIVFATVVVFWKLSKARKARETTEVSPLLKAKEAKDVKDSGTEEDANLDCCICLDAKKDSFFDPCGHSATCLACGLQIRQRGSQCPICRQDISKVRKLFL